MRNARAKSAGHNLPTGQHAPIITIFTNWLTGIKPNKDESTEFKTTDGKSVPAVFSVPGSFCLHSAP
jgi:hypothetical protein